MIVGSTEADPSASPKRLSNESPVGKALLGPQEGRHGQRARCPPARSRKLKIAKIAV